MTTISILGANGHIAKGLTVEIAREGQHELILYSRQQDLVDNFLTDQHLQDSEVTVRHIDDFGSIPCDVVINTIGAGDPKTVRNFGNDILAVTARYDDAVMSFLGKKNQDARYIFLSSGAVYGNGAGPRKKDYQALPCPDFLPRPDSDYAQSKIIAETRHRDNPDLKIIDLRIFGYFSRYIDLPGEFLMAEIARSILHETEFVTGPGQLVRDYCVPQDLWGLISACISGAGNNMAMDVYSRGQVDKNSLLEMLKSRFGLNYSIKGPDENRLDAYFSESRTAERTGFHPQYNSIEGIVTELSAMVASWKKKQEP